MKDEMPFGGWHSPISTDLIIQGTPKLQETSVESGRIFWLQTLPEEKGRITIMMYDGKQIHSLLPRPLSTKSKVHEYGGGSYSVAGNKLFFVLADDQRIYCTAINPADNLGEESANLPPFEPIALSPEDTSDRQLRFADLVWDAAHQRLIVVCEEHTSANSEPLNYLACVNLNASEEITPLVHGDDFYSNPRISPDGRWLSWLSWNHPHMPWDSTQLWLAEFDPQGQLGKPFLVAGAQAESIFQPQWSPKGDLFFVSDRDNWWNIYCFSLSVIDNNTFSASNKNLLSNLTNDNGVPDVTQVTNLQAEFATPQWTFNMSTYAFLRADKIIAAYNKGGHWQLCSIQLANTKKPIITTIQSTLTEISSVSANNNQAAFIGASSQTLPAVFQIADSAEELLQSYPINSVPLDLIDEDIATPLSITFATSGGHEAHAYFYPPTNACYQCTPDKPPLIVICHGGPTGATDDALNLKIQYWTNRGFAILDVNYRGSTGYGREYRQLLYKKWGEYDVDDVCAGAEYVVAQGWADPGRLIIKGSSAGGYTVLAALTFRNTFSTGVSLYGIGDLDTLVRDTHKFEAKYLETLVGDYQHESSIYYQRSPINFTDKLSCPLLVFQGLEDKVVPPNQAIAMVEAVKAKGLPVAYVAYAQEGHGFRSGENICHMLRAEQYFYCKVFELAIPDDLVDFIPIHNL